MIRWTLLIAIENVNWIWLRLQYITDTKSGIESEWWWWRWPTGRREKNPLLSFALLGIEQIHGEDEDKDENKAMAESNKQRDYIKLPDSVVRCCAENVSFAFVPISFAFAQLRFQFRKMKRLKYAI